MLIYKENYLQKLAGEWVVFMCLSIYILAACLKDGIWDRRLKATPKTNLIVSAIAAVLLALINFFISLRNYGDMKTAVLTAVLLLIGTFLPCFAALSFFSAIYKKRRNALESDDEAAQEKQE